MNKDLAIIIPFGTSEKRDFIRTRVLEKIEQLKNIQNIEVIFVEGYSSKIEPSIENEIKRAGFNYIKDETQEIFSVGACRNLGVTYSKSPVFMFLDVDYYISKENIDKLIKLIKVKQIDKFPNRFICLPCAFLSQEGSENLLTTDKAYWDIKVAFDLNNEKHSIVKFLAITSSSIVMNRHKFLELGGNDLSYKGHGYEDFDFYYRLFKASCRIEVPPKDIEFDARSWNFTEYKGFRALFSVPGYESAFYGIYLYHFWHPEPNNDGYLDSRKINHDKFYNVIKTYSCQANGPDPLILAENNGNNVLAFIKENSKVYRALRGIIPYLGNLICMNEEMFFESGKFVEEKLIRYINTNKISQVFFPNPYGNQYRIEIYNYVREKNIPYICFDRGALPDSWFFDFNGFNFDSKSYLSRNWDNDLTNEELDKTVAYIENIKSSNNYLEMQNAREGGESLKKKLGIRNKKIIFVPGQVEYDTVIKYFSDKISYYEFFKALNDIAKELEDENIIILAKKHPLMNGLKKENYENIKWAPDNTNINDLLECCEKVITMNSGVGLYALIYNKPCATVGHAFYEGDGLAVHCNYKEDIIEFIRSNQQPDKNQIIKFIHYLVYRFYCFGKSYYTQVETKNGEIRRIVNYIDFYRININNNCLLDGLSADLFKYKKDSLAFRVYLEACKIQQNQENTKKIQKDKQDLLKKQEKKIEESKENKIRNEINVSLTGRELRNKKLRKAVRHPYLYIRDFFLKKISRKK